MKEKKIIIQYEGQKNEDSQTAYIYFKEDLRDGGIGESKRQVIYDGYESEEAKKEELELVVDFDEEGKIIGIEIISNRNIIPKNLLMG